MRRQSALVSFSGSMSDQPVLPHDLLSHVVIFVAGVRSRAESAINEVRRIYPGRHLVFICEPAHCAWLPQCLTDSVVVIEQPFNPFGQRASQIRKSLEATSIEACALVVADVGLESLRFRIFALRLRTELFLLLDPAKPAASKQVSRFSFALLAGVTLVLGRLRKIGKWIIVDLFTRAGHRELKDRLYEELSALVVTHTVELHRCQAVARAGAGGSIKRGFKSALVSLGTRYLDKRYRRVFQNLIDEPWERWFNPRNFPVASITLVIGTLGPGGSERQAVTTLLGLASHGYRDLSLLCNLDGYVNSFYAHLLEGCPVSVSEVSEDFRDTNNICEGDEALAQAGLRAVIDKLPPEVKDIACYVREFLKRKPSVVHAWLDYTNVRAGLAAAIIGIPRIVLSTRSVAPDNFAFFQPYMREAYRLLAQRPNVCLLNNSEAGARDYEQWLDLPRGTIKVVRNGFDFSALERAEKIAAAQELRARLGISPDVAVVGSVVRFSEEKRPLLWIDVAESIAKRRPDVIFLLVGDGPLREQARQRAERCGLGDRVVMPGREKDAAVAITAIDVFLLTSRVEGLPNVLIEAQALGVPVVTTDAGGAAETLIQGRTGYAIFPHLAELLADAVLRILADVGWRETARKAAQEFVRNRFSLTDMIDRTLDAYFTRNELTSHRSPPTNP